MADERVTVKEIESLLRDAESAHESVRRAEMLSLLLNIAAACIVLLCLFHALAGVGMSAMMRWMTPDDAFFDPGLEVAGFMSIFIVGCAVVVLVVTVFVWRVLRARLQNTQVTAFNRRMSALRLIETYLPNADLDEFAAARCMMRLDALRNNEAT